MPAAAANGIEIAYDTFGDPDDPTLLLVMGLGASLVSWPDDFCEAFVDRGFHVVRFDNRDVGRSTWIDAPGFEAGQALAEAFAGGAIEAPYLIADMAADAAGLLDHLGVDRAHVVGASMGGMIAQQLAIDHPQRVWSLTSIMSTTGDPDVGAPRSDVLPVLVERPPADREAYIEHAVGTSRVIGSPDHFEEDRVRARHRAHFDRGYNPRGAGQQLCAILASGSRSDRLRTLDVPTLVAHGDRDPLVDISGGRRTAEVIPAADLLVLEGMGHDLPTYFWAPLIDRVTALAASAAAAV
jgi:pimeloyl-ACP methyl ester carboxylesterase